MVRFWCLVISILVSGEVTFAEYRPDLYLDGEAMANAITPWILENTEAVDRLDHTDYPASYLYLFYGARFGWDYNANIDKSNILKSWILSQEDNSIKPVAFYQKAIEIAGGNVEDGLVLAWNFLIHRKGEKRKRNDFPYQQKLYDITGEFEVFEGNKGPNGRVTVRGDKFSAWYHFAGTALNSFHEANRISSIPTGCSNRTISGFAKAKTNFALLMEHFGNRFRQRTLFNEGMIDKLKKQKIDEAGAEFGAALWKNLMDHEYSTSEEFLESSPNRTYLYDNPSVYGPKWRLREGQKPWEWDPPEDI